MKLTKDQRKHLDLVLACIRTLMSVFTASVLIYKLWS